MDDIEIGRLYKTKHIGLNMGEHLYTLSKRHLYTESGYTTAIKVIQIDKRFENKVTEFYDHQISNYYVLVENE